VSCVDALPSVLWRNRQTIATNFEVQTGKPTTTLVLKLNQETFTIGIEAKSEKPSPPIFFAKLVKTVAVVLRPNH
jgi:hypothetical protein